MAAQNTVDPLPALERECRALFDAYEAAGRARERADGTHRETATQAAEEAASDAFDAAVERAAAARATSPAGIASKLRLLRIDTIAHDPVGLLESAIADAEKLARS